MSQAKEGCVKPARGPIAIAEASKTELSIGSLPEEEE